MVTKLVLSRVPVEVEVERLIAGTNL